MTKKESISISQTANEEHGTVKSYVIGFVLSLIFTVIPYHLVANKVLTGNSLLFAILAIAVCQMIIQLVFFLHLGRGPKPFYNVVFFVATGGTIVVVIGASLFIMDNLYRTMSPQEMIVKQSQEENIAQISGKETGACNELRESHRITINNGVASPSHTQARLCDTITFIIEDGIDREIVFGPHPDHVSYGGMYEVYSSVRRPETITLNQAGEFTFHDHLMPGLTGSFSVEP